MKGNELRQEGGVTRKERLKGQCDSLGTFEKNGLWASFSWAATEKADEVERGILESECVRSAGARVAFILTTTGVAVGVRALLVSLTGRL